MIVVMLVLLSATATAAFAVHSTSYELSAAGFQKQAIQADYGAEAGLHAVFAVLNQSANPAARVRTLGQQSGSCGAEPSLPAGQDPDSGSAGSGSVGRLVNLEEIPNDTGGVAPLDREGLGGARQTYMPRFFVCIYDQTADNTPVAGGAVAGGGEASMQQSVRMTISSYSTMQLDVDGDEIANDESDDVDPEAFETWDRSYHEVSTGARAHLVTDPVSVAQ
jgi:hypothetical protein